MLGFEVDVADICSSNERCIHCLVHIEHCCVNTAMSVEKLLENVTCLRAKQRMLAKRRKLVRFRRTVEILRYLIGKLESVGLMLWKRFGVFSVNAYAVSCAINTCVKIVIGCDETLLEIFGRRAL